MKRPQILLACLLCVAAAHAEEFAAVQVRVSPAVQAVDVALSRFGTYTAVADATEGNSVRVLDEHGELLWRHRQPLYWAATLKRAPVLQFAPDESFLIFPAYRTENDIALVNPRTGEPLSVLTGHEGTVDCLVLSPDGTRLVSASRQEVFLWKRQGATFVQEDKIAGFTGSVGSMAFSPDGGTLALAVYDDMTRRIVLYRVGDRLTEVTRYETKENNLGHEYSQLAFSPDGRWLAAGYADSLLVFDPKGGRLRLAQKVAGIELGPVISLAFSPDGALLFTGHVRDVRAWRVSDWKEAATFSPHLWHVNAMRFSMDGSLLAIAGGADTNALGFFSLKGVAPSPLGSLLSLLKGRVSSAQKAFLGEDLARQILAVVPADELAPRDMFETEAEYAARQGKAQARAASALQEATEKQFGAQREPASGAMYEVAVPLQGRGSYAIDSRTYSLPFMDTEATAKLDRDPARELYQNWQRVRVYATRVQTPEGTTYDDFRVVLPMSHLQCPLGLSENPFTGERLDRYGTRVPSTEVGPDLLVRNLAIEGVFPALYHYYAEHALGTMTLQNTGSATVTDLSVQFMVPGLMKTPTDAAVATTLGVGQSQDVDIRALFDPSVLDRSEGASVTAELSVRYASGGKSYAQTIRRPIGLLNRNAMRWTDDRKVGAFMSVNDPAFLRFSGQVMGMGEEPSTSVLTRGLLSAARLFAAMKAAGVRYVVDPSSAYESLSRDSTAIDFVRFPVETLDARSGDCDDLSVLYDSLLESVGVDTAYITTPGHIFTAFDLGVSPEQASRIFGKTDDLILRQGVVWMPVETTMIDDGFVKAWQTAAGEWRVASGRDAANFFTSKEAWKRYLPAGFSVAQPAVPPARDRVASLLGDEIDAFRSVVLAPREADLLKSLPPSPTPAQQNQLGMLYAQFGLFSRALERFEKGVSANYLPALINAANVYSLQRDFHRAQEYLKRAQQLQPDNARVLAALAFSYYEEGNEPEARSTFDRMSRIDPGLAQRYPLFGSSSGEGGQARAGRADSGAQLFGTDWVQ